MSCPPLSSDKINQNGISGGPIRIDIPGARNITPDEDAEFKRLLSKTVLGWTTPAENERLEFLNSLRLSHIDKLVPLNLSRFELLESAACTNADDGRRFGAIPTCRYETCDVNMELWRWQ